MKKKDDVAFYRDQQNNIKATMSSLNKVLQACVLRRLKCEGIYGPTTQDIEWASSGKKSSSSQLSTVCTNTNASLHTKEISTSMHQEKEKFVLIAP